MITFVLMKSMRRILLAVAVAAAALLAAGCGVSRIKDIRLDSAGVKYIVPTSARSLDAVLLLSIENPAMSFTVSNVEGAVRQEDKVLVTFTAGPLPLEGKTTRVYELPCTATLADGVSYLDLLVIAARRSLDGLKADVNLYAATKNGVLGAPLSFKDIDLAQFSR